MNSPAIRLVTGLLSMFTLAAQTPPNQMKPVQIGVFIVAPPGSREEIPADLVLQSGHAGRITAISFSSDGNVLASASEDKTLRLWDPKSGRQLAVLQGHTAPVRTLAFNADGSLLALGSDDGTIRIWNVPSAKSSATLEGHQEPVTALSFSPNGSRLVSGGAGSSTNGGAGSIRLWDVSSFRQIRILEPKEFGLTSVFFAPDNSRIYAASQSGDMEIRGTVKIYGAETGQLLETRGEILRAASTDGQTVAIQRGQWATQTVQLFHRGVPAARFSGSIGAIAFSPSADWVAYSLQPEGKVVVRRTGEERSGGVIESGNRGTETLALSPHGTILATAVGPVINLWNVAEGRLARVIAPQFGVNAIAFSPDSKRVVSLAQGDGDGAVRVWDIATASELDAPAIRTGGTGAAISPDGNLLGATGRILELWDLRSNTRIRELQCPGDVVISPTFSPDSRLIAGNCQGVITVWHVASGAVVFQTGHMNSGVVAFSPDGRFLAAGTGLDGFALYDLATSKAARTFSIGGRLSALAFSSDGRTLAAGTRAPLRFKPGAQGGPGSLEPADGQSASIAAWDVSTGRQLFSLSARHWVGALAFRKDGSSLLAVTGNVHAPGALEVYSLAGRKLATLIEKVDAGSAATFSPDRTWLAGSGSGPAGAVKLWRVSQP